MPYKLVRIGRRAPRERSTKNVELVPDLASDRDYKDNVAECWGSTAAEERKALDVIDKLDVMLMDLRIEEVEIKIKEASSIIGLGNVGIGDLNTKRSGHACRNGKAGCVGCRRFDERAMKFVTAVGDVSKRLDRLEGRLKEETGKKHRSDAYIRLDKSSS